MSEKMVETIGIIGGGQLGRMLAQAAIPLGFSVNVLEVNAADCPAVQVGARPFEGSPQDAGDLRRFVQANDVTTWEFEHFDADTLADMDGHDIQPDPRTLVRVQNKLEQKTWLRDLGFPVGDFTDNYYWFANGSKWTNAIIKTKYGGFDGRGNYQLRDGEILDKKPMRDFLKEKFDNKPTYAEVPIDYEQELSVIAARDRRGKVVTYPVIETIQQEGICHMAVSPARISKKLAVAATNLAQDVMKGYLLEDEGAVSAGVFAIEMFAGHGLSDTDLLINEIAPRVHNSGHLTLDAHKTSQFEQHIRAITGLPLGSTEQIIPAAAMINILGTEDKELDRMGLEKILKMPDTHVHLYGKRPKKNRKIGHITVLAYDPETAIARAKRARGFLTAV